MAQDIRELLKQDKEEATEKLPAGHRKRFESRLEQALPQRKENSRYMWLKIAAVFVVALGVGYFFLYQQEFPADNPVVNVPGEEQEENSSEKIAGEENLTLADISPEFKKVEDYYLANLNLGLAKIDITEENKALIDAFMTQLAELDKEYDRLNGEISKNGPNAETVEALINNLQLRLDLLFKLKNKLDELKKEKNEKFEKIQV